MSKKDKINKEIENAWSWIKIAAPVGLSCYAYVVSAIQDRTVGLGTATAGMVAIATTAVVARMAHIVNKKTDALEELP